MKSYSDKITTTEAVEERLGNRVDKIEKKVTYTFIAGILIGASSIGFDVFSYIKFFL